MTSKSIYILDDDEGVGLTLKKMGESIGWSCRSFQNSDDVFGCLGKEKPGVLFLDIELGPENGFEILKKWRRSPISRGIPVVMLTGHSSKDLVVQAMELGASDYLVKPIAQDRLQHTLDNIYRRQSLAAKNFPDTSKLSKVRIQVDARLISMGLDEVELETSAACQVDDQLSLLGHISEMLEIPNLRVKVIKCSPSSDKFLVKAKIILVSPQERENLKDFLARA